MTGDRITVVRIQDVLMAVLPASPDDAAISGLQEEVLRAMEQSEPKGVVFDISAVDTLDSFFARTLVETARMIRLMGGRTVIAGMRPEVAITATQLGLGFGDIETRLDVEGALAHVRDAHQPGDPR